MKQLTLITFLLLTLLGIAQVDQNTQTPSEENNWRLFPSKNKVEKEIDTVQLSENKTLVFGNKKGIVNISQPNEITELTETLRNKPYILGYTVQLEVSQQTSKIRNARYKLLKIKPNAQLEETWLPPNTYLYAGVFYSRTDAFLFKKEIASYFPNATVISKKMNLPTLNSDTK